MITVDFVNEDDVVEQRLKLDNDAEYLCLDHTMLGEYTIAVDSKCRVMHQNEFDMIVSNGEKPSVELTAGNFIVVAQTGVEVPDWETICRDS